MRIEKTENLGAHSYFLASKKMFFHRFADSGFKNKWCGLWAGNKKCVEYFALKCYNEWLSEHNAKKVSYFGSHCVQEFDSRFGTLKQTLFVPKDKAMLAIQLETKKEAWFELELAINMREREENLHYREYKTKEFPKGLMIESELGTLVFAVEKGQKTIKPGSAYKEHFPASEQQRFFLPAKIFLKGKKIVFYLSFFEKKTSLTKSGNFDKLLKEKIEEYENAVDAVFLCNNKQLQHGFNWAIVDLLLLENSQAFFAGFPWFLQFWARDLFWSLPAIIDLGYFEKAKKILRMFAESAAEGKIANVLYNGKASFNGIDATPLWIIALAHYYWNSADKEFLREMKSHLNSALRFLQSRDTDNDGLIEHDESENETWMDSRNRKENAIEVQALYIKALDEAALLFKELGEEKRVKELNAMAFHSADSIERFRVFENFFADRLIKKAPVAEQTCNALVPAMLGVCSRQDARHVLLEAESDFLDAKKGIRTLSKLEAHYNPAGYHNGAVWSLSTAWASAADFFWKRSEKGEHFLHKLLVN